MELSKIYLSYVKLAKEISKSNKASKGLMSLYYFIYQSKHLDSGVCEVMNVLYFLTSVMSVSLHHDPSI